MTRFVHWAFVVSLPLVHLLAAGHAAADASSAIGAGIAAGCAGTAGRTTATVVWGAASRLHPASEASPSRLYPMSRTLPAFLKPDLFSIGK